MSRRRCTRSNHCGPVGARPGSYPQLLKRLRDKRLPKHAERNGRANKAANQANGITEKAYVDQCRGGAAPSKPLLLRRLLPPAPTAAPAAPLRHHSSRSSGQARSPTNLNRQTGPHHSGKSRWGE